MKLKIFSIILIIIIVPVSAFSNMKLDRFSDVIKVFSSQTDVKGLTAVIKGKVISFASKNILDEEDLQGWARPKNKVTVRLYNIKGIKTTTVCPSLVTTGMFEGTKAPRLTPFLTPEKMVDLIYDGIKKDKVMVKAPFMVKTIPLFKALTHPDHLAAIGEMLGSSDIMDEYTGRHK